jgi:hypothetical protein
MITSPFGCTTVVASACWMLRHGEVRVHGFKSEPRLAVTYTCAACACAIAVRVSDNAISAKAVNVNLIFELGMMNLLTGWGIRWNGRES